MKIITMHKVIYSTQCHFLNMQEITIKRIRSQEWGKAFLCSSFWAIKSNPCYLIKILFKFQNWIGNLNRKKDDVCRILQVRKTVRLYWVSGIPDGSTVCFGSTEFPVPCQHHS